MTDIIHQDLSDKLIGLAFKVHNALGPGLLEHCYQEAMCVELRLGGIPFERQKVFPLVYRGFDIGGYIADPVIDNKVILELKSVQEFSPVMSAQLINYLRLSGIPVGYLINFHGLKVEWKRHSI